MKKPEEMRSGEPVAFESGSGGRHIEGSPTLGFRCPFCRAPASEFDPRCPACGLPLATLPEGEVAPTGTEDRWLGRQVAHFRIESRLGSGGMGVVYRALDLELGRPVALKFLSSKPRNARDGERFRREAQLAARLEHPNIATLYEVGEHEGWRFLAMAYCPGETLAKRLERGALTLEAALDVAVQLANALVAAHGAGIVHRDLKPANVILSPDGLVKLLDFGVALAEGSDELTQEGMAVGTVRYMAPEQIRGGRIDARADLWAFGVVLFEMLAGRHPFDGHEGSLVSAILNERPPRLASLVPDLPRALGALVERCLARRPTDRYASAAEVRAALAEIQGSTVGLATLPPPRRWLWAVAGAGAAALALLAGLGLWRAASAREPFAVALLRPTVEGAATEAEERLIAANLEVAAFRTLGQLEGVAALDPSSLAAVAGGPVAVARSVGASELVTARAECAGDVCQVLLNRLAGNDGRVLASAAQVLPASRPRVSAEAISASLRSLFPERRLRRGGLELVVEEDDYRRYLELRRRVEERREPVETLLAETAELRRTSPRFVEAYALEASLARHLFTTRGDRAWLQRGLEVAEAAHRLSASDPRPLASRFDLELAAEDLGAAAATLAGLERLEPGAPSTLVRRAMLAERRGDLEAARRQMGEVVARQPSWQYLLMLANMDYRQGRPAEARVALGELLARSPGQPQGLRMLAQLELLSGEAVRAVALLSELAAGKPRAEDLTNLGVAFLLVGRFDEAERTFRQARGPAPWAPETDEPQLLLNLADSVWLQGRQEEAAALYRAVADAGSPEAGELPWSLWSARAQAHAHLGERAPAVQAIERALRSAPESAQLAVEAALVYACLGDDSSALYHATRALEGGAQRHWFDLPWFDSVRDRLPAVPADLTGSRSGPRPG